MHIYHKSRYQARKRYYEKEENKEKKRIYMREYEKRPEVIARKKNWGGKRQESEAIKNIHEAWAKVNGYRGASNENLNIENSERFINYEKEKTQ